MKIENFVRIIDGKLSTTPPIDAFGSICLEITRLSHGDLFIDTQASRENIHQALEKGAYAIVTILPFENEDEECAWIEVSSIEGMLIKLLRYTITQKSLEFLLLSPVQEAFLEMIQVAPKPFKRLKGDVVSITKSILIAKEEERFFLSNEPLAHKIAPLCERIENNLHVKPFIIPKGLFLSSFTYNERFYAEQKIPALFVEELITLLHFCDTHDIAYTIEHLGFSEHFYPQYITHSFVKKEFGTSDKVLIFEPTFELLPRLCTHLFSSLKSQHALLCLPEHLHYNFPFDGERLWFKTPQELLRELASKSFTYALIVSSKESFDLLFSKESSTIQATLF
ncbi:hypothetical protein [Sulfurospirillum deleyianum]|uniref:Ferrochelatase n=1 Tax=Sulfurospirillum deleyianum (strain ATCC 51133 / DSM 6946 / 5175) TaxID=525898 RepID=D1B091_SULD5|nr:hypothetical protein [Sulfurospirillum deleyianum]ACZ11708.1 hypothetical protein Sdel_0672 [Sulfurospirillum deleyianum DSM 6946]